MTDQNEMSAGGGLREEFPAPGLTADPLGQERAMATLSDLVRATTRAGAVWRNCAGCGSLAALAPDSTTCPACASGRSAPFRVRPAGTCPRGTASQLHAWRHADGTDLIGLADGGPDHGVVVHLGRCAVCGVALLAIGPYAADFTDLSFWMELPDVDLAGEVTA